MQPQFISAINRQECILTWSVLAGAALMCSETSYVQIGGFFQDALVADEP